MNAKPKARYWGLHLDERSRRPTPVRTDWRPHFSLQLLAPGGGPSEKIAYFDASATDVVLENEHVPAVVIEVVKALDEGAGVYLAADGTAVEPF
jgi:hypothetical protein